MRRDTDDQPAPNVQLQQDHQPGTRGYLLLAAKDVNLNNLPPNARLVVRTWNSLYRLVVLEPRPEVLVQGGLHFQGPTEVLFRGARRTDGALKPRRIVVGLRMEVWGPAGSIVTSPVRSIEIEVASLHGGF